MRIKFTPILGGAALFTLLVASVPTAEARGLGGAGGIPVSPGWIESGNTCWKETGGGIQFILSSGCTETTGEWEVPASVDSVGSKSMQFFLDQGGGFGSTARCAAWWESPTGATGSSPWVALTTSGEIATASVSIGANGALFGICDLQEGYNAEAAQFTAAPMLHTVVWTD